MSCVDANAAVKAAGQQPVEVFPRDLRVAIVHYWYSGNGLGGGERVIEAFSSIFPRAEFFALVASERGIPPALRDRSVKTSFVGRLPGAKRWHRHFLPLYPFALEQFDLSGYDVVISSESGPAKGVITSPQTCHICYCHTPMRYLWDMYHEYKKKMNPVTRTIFSVTAHYARQWDVNAAARVDYFAANSRHVAARIRKYYRRESTVIYPPVDVSGGYISSQTEDYYLLVSRLVPYKRADLAVAACNRLGRRLRVVGTGPEYKELKKRGGSTIEFLGKLDGNSLRETYAHCRALLFPGEEDFGIVPVEAQSHGRPVIAYGRGGALETVRGLPVDGERNETSPTGLFFHEPSVEALCNAIVRFEEMESSFHPESIRGAVKRFDTERFKLEFAEFAARKMRAFGQPESGPEG